MKKNQGYVVAVVGATGAVGREFLSILGERGFPLRELRPLASERSDGTRVECGGESIPVRKLSPESFSGVDLAFFSAGSAISREFAPVAARQGALVIDNTSAFRLEDDVPLAVPEVNPKFLSERPSRSLISVPNCTTIQLVMALAPLQKAFGLKRVVVSTYQAVSGAGRRAMEELSSQVAELMRSGEVEPKVFPRRIAFDLIPQIGDFREDGSCFEEEKICAETRKILGDASLGMSATTVRVPTFHGHAESVNLETTRPVDPNEARAALAEAEGVTVMDAPNLNVYPVLNDVQGKDDVMVGRIRKDASRPNCLNLWIVSDNLRKGAALNGVQIAETLVRNQVI